VRELVDHDVVRGIAVTGPRDILPGQQDAADVPGLAGQHQLLLGDHPVLVVPAVGHDELRRVHQYRAQRRVRVTVLPEHQQAGLRRDGEAHLVRERDTAAGDELLLAGEHGSQRVQPRHERGRHARITGPGAREQPSCAG
jgi:hypothetical protein